MGDAGYLLQRRRETRLQRFGLALGLLVAMSLHAVLFWGPEVEYRPVLEQARVRRVLVARPYQPRVVHQPEPPPVEKPPVPVNRAASQAPPRPEPPAAGVPEPTQARAEAAGRGRENTGVRQATGDIGVAGSSRPERVSRESASPLAGGDAWEALMADLVERKQTLQEQWEERRREVASRTPSHGSSDASAGFERVRDQAYLDSLIRTTVVSYPPSTLDEVHPRISYPDLRFRKQQLQAGTCRVYYRVWTDSRGRVRRTQLKTPSTPEDQKVYAPFIEAVKSSVSTWPFEPRETEVHIDVLFEIE